jgi:DNA-binding beta-propeller fold protein YncE
MQPTGLALDGSGNLYVGDAGQARVNVFNAQTGQFLRAFGKDVGGPGVGTCTLTCAAGVSDGSPGSIGPSYSLSFAGGEVFIPEFAASRVSVFGEDGSFRRVIGAPGTGAGQLTAPYGAAADAASGNLYVAETGNNRLSNFGVSGDFRNARGFDVIPGEPLNVEVCTTICKAGVAETGVGSFTGAWSVALDCRGAVYVGMIGRIEKYADPALRKPPCPSNAFTIGKLKKNKKKGTATVSVTVPGPGTLTASLGKKLTAKVPQPQAAGALKVTVKAAGKGVKALAKKGRLKGNLKLTFTPPNGDPNTQSKKLTLAKKLKKKKSGKGGKGK